MYHEDYTRIDKDEAEMYYMGWLETDRPHVIGDTPPGFLDKLLLLRERLHANQMRGYHECQFCPPHANEHPKTGLPYYDICDQYIFLGSAEIWVPDGKKEKVFCAPDLILHYIGKHKYLPHQDFINAVMDFDIDSDWTMMDDSMTLIGRP
jgi:hypothetical protein